jgi:hypothetical protein
MIIDSRSASKLDSISDAPEPFSRALRASRPCGFAVS